MVIAAVLALHGCKERNKLVAPPPARVTVSQPTRDQVQDYLEASGNTQSIVTVQLTARVPGYLEKVLFHDGDIVNAGQTLFIIEQAPYKARLQQAEGQVQQVKADLAHAENQLRRFAELLRRKLTAETEAENWSFQRDHARAALIAAEAQRDLARLDLTYTQIVAPFTGRIDRRLVDPGNLVGVGGNTILASMSQLDPMYVYFTINERDLLRRMNVTGVTPAEVAALKIPVDMGLANDNSHPFHGVLDFTGISLNATTGTLQLRAVFPNSDNRILPGLFAKVRAQRINSRRDALLVPETAVGYDQQGSYLLIVNKDKVVERRSVVTDIVHGERRVIQSGLNGDEQVVVSGLLRAIPGTTVDPVMATAEADSRRLSDADRKP